MREALIALAGFVPEGGEWWTIQKENNDYYSEGDEKAPLMSEGFLYWLAGKEDGRTLLSRFNHLCRSLNFDPHEIHNEVYRRAEAEKKRAADALKRRQKTNAMRDTNKRSRTGGWWHCPHCAFLGRRTQRTEHLSACHGLD